MNYEPPHFIIHIKKKYRFGFVKNRFLENRLIENITSFFKNWKDELEIRILENLQFLC